MTCCRYTHTEISSTHLLFFTDLGEEHEQRIGQRYSGGFEMHWRSPPYYMLDAVPTIEKIPKQPLPCPTAELWTPQGEPTGYVYDASKGIPWERIELDISFLVHGQ